MRMDSTEKKLRLDHTRALQGIAIPENEQEQVLAIAQKLAATLNDAAGRLPFDAEPAGFTRAMAELTGPAPQDSKKDRRE